MKKIILMLLVGTMCLSLSACGGENNQQAATDGTVSQQEAKKENNEDESGKIRNNRLKVHTEI